MLLKPGNDGRELNSIGGVWHRDATHTINGSIGSGEKAKDFCHVIHEIILYP
jgi:hypothetical protein